MQNMHWQILGHGNNWLYYKFYTNNYNVCHQIYGLKFFEDTCFGVRNLPLACSIKRAVSRNYETLTSKTATKLSELPFKTLEKDISQQIH